MKTFADGSGDIEQVADRRGSNSAFEMRKGQRAGINAVDPVGFVGGNFYISVFLQIVLEQFGGIGDGASAKDFHFAFFADKDSAAAIGVIQSNGQTVRVTEREFWRGAYPIAACGRFRFIILVPLDFPGIGIDRKSQNY